jgi:two-component system cell cycle sensor histidine kinase/response regulator CckA
MRSLFDRSRKDITDNEPSEAKKLKKNLEASTGRKERVLVMDDDAFIRGITRSMLLESGYDIRVAKNGAEAIKYFKEAKVLGHPFDIVILDLHVPSDMGGDQAIEKLRDIDPGVNAILMTADINHPAVTHYEALGFKTAVIKPFTRDDLLQALYRASEPS